MQKNDNLNLVEEKEKKGIFYYFRRFLRFSFGNTFKQVADGLYIEALRDVVKWVLALIGTSLISLFATGIGNFDWSLRSFNWFNTINKIESVNDEIRPNAVWEIPRGVTVKVKGAGFLTFSSSSEYSKAVQLSYVGLDNKTSSRMLSAGKVLSVKDGCHSLGFINMKYVDKDKFLLLYQDNEIIDCRYNQ